MAYTIFPTGVTLDIQGKAKQANHQWANCVG